MITIGRKIMNHSFQGRLQYFVVGFIGMVGLIMVLSIEGFAQNTKKSGGLNFQVPEDWPIEKRGGVLAPIPTEEYVLNKFKEVAEEFELVRDAFEVTSKDFSTELKNVEGRLASEIKKMKEDAGSVDGGGSSSGGTAEASKNVEALQSESARLDRKITNKVLEMQSKFEDINQQIVGIEKSVKGIQTQLYKLDEKIDFMSERTGASH